MEFLQQETLLDLIFCIAIVVLAYIQYRNSKTALPIYIGAAFGLFGISHLLTILGQAVNYSALLMTIRSAAYLIIIIALVQSYQKLTEKKKE